MSHSLTVPKGIQNRYFTEKQLRNCLSFEVNNILNENEHLKNKIESLKKDYSELQLKNENLDELVKEKTKKFEEKVGKLEEEIKNNKLQLMDQQKKNFDEIKKLKEEKEKLNIIKTQTEANLTEKSKSLEAEIALFKLNEENLKNENLELCQKSSKYKLKLKQAIKIINELNNLVVYYNTKPVLSCETTQTEGYSIQNSLECTLCDSKILQKDLATENMLLEDIFFKPKPFQESDIDIILC